MSATQSTSSPAEATIPVPFLRAVRGFDKVISGVSSGCWDSRSPCSEWTAADVVGHVIYCHSVITNLAHGKPWPGPDAHPPAPRQLAGEDPVASWRQANATTLEALTAEAVASVVSLPYGQMTLRDALDKFLPIEFVAHAWDLAMAAEIPSNLDPELVHDCFMAVMPFDEYIRVPYGYGPKQPVSESAPETERFMAFLGRRVT